MGLKTSFEKASSTDLSALKRALEETSAYNWSLSLELNDKHRLALVSLSLVFFKTIAIDREILESEVREVRKKLAKFIELDGVTLLALLNATKKDLRSQGPSTAQPVATAAAFLGKSANDSTKQRIFRYLIQIIAVDRVIENEERYFLELVGAAFEYTQKSVNEYLLAAELHADQSVEQESFSTEESSQSTPTIKFDLG